MLVRIRNKICADGIDKLPIFNASGQLDFSLIAPVPKEVQRLSTPSSIDCVIWYLTYHGRNHVNDDIVDTVREMFPDTKMPITLRLCRALLADVKDMIMEGIEMDSSLYMSGRDSVACFAVTGSADEESWYLAHWGTLHNAVSTHTAPDMIDFVTYDTVPKGAMQALSALYPDLVITHWWYNEDVYDGSHRILWHNGK